MKNEISEKKLAVLTAYNKGYRVVKGDVFYKGKMRKVEFKHKRHSGNAYGSFGIRVESGKRVNVYVHHLVAYQKFGENFLHPEKEDMIVLHLDGDTTNNLSHNIDLGDRSKVRSIRDRVTAEQNKL